METGVGAAVEDAASIDFMAFENDEHQSVLLEAMKAMFDSNELVDVTICVQQRIFQCHRNVLAATSPYFHAMFTSDLNESKQERVHLHEVDGSSVELVIEYAYTGKIEITRGNAQNLLAVASLFQIIPIHQACARFMETQLDITNCIGIYHFGQIHNCKDLHVKAREHIEKNFVEVSKGEEFMSLDFVQAADILTSNELNVEKEELVYEAVMRWVEHDVEMHRPFLPQLLPLVRVGLISSKYIHENIANDKVRMKTHEEEFVL